MDTVTRVQTLDETDSISHSTNALGKGMNPIILPPTMGKIVGQTMFFSLGDATCLGEGNSEFKPVKLRLKIDIVSYPARAEGLVNIYIYIYIYRHINFSQWFKEKFILVEEQQWYY